MTYITYQTQFWREYRKKRLSPLESLLYSFLVDVWNSTGRKDKFECNTSEIEIVLGMNKVTLTRCREGLRKRGLIQYVKGDRKTKSPFYILCFVTNDVTNNVTNDVTNNVTNDVTNDVTNNVTNDVTNNVTNDVTTHRVYRDTEKETSSNEEVKKVSKKTKSSVKELPICEVIDESKNERMDWKAFEDFYNSTVSSKLPKIKGVNERRRKLVKTVIKENGKDSIVTVLNYVVNSPWHTGSNDRGWTADFEWIFNSTNYSRLLDKARNHGASNNQANGQLRINSGAVQDQSIDIYKELFGYDGPPDKFEEWFNRNPYGG